MVHSVELLFDADTDAAVRQIWDDLAAAGIRSLAGHTSPSNRPHVTVSVAADMDGTVDVSLRPLLDLLPLDCVIGAPMMFGGGRSVTLVRLVVPSPELLNMHAEVHRVCLPHMPKGPLPHADPGRWTPHVTLARRVAPGQLPVAVALPQWGRDIGGRITGLRHWDGDARREYPIT